MPETKELAKKSPLDTMRELFDKHKPALKDLLPPHVKEKEVISAAINACRENPALLECTPQSMLGAVAKCCQLGLPPADGTHRVCLVPFRSIKKNCTEAQLIVEYRGLIYLSQNLQDMTPNNQVVCRNDKFEYDLGSHPFIKHRLPVEGDRGDILGAYALLEVTGKPPIIEYMTKKEIDEIRARSKASSSGPWVTDYSMMARKTVLRRALRLAPMSTKRGELLQQALQLDEKAELGMPQDLAMFADPQATATVKTNQDKIDEAERARTNGISEVVPTLAKPEKPMPEFPKPTILTPEQFQDVKDAFAEVKTLHEANNAFLGLPPAWQEIPNVQSMYSEICRKMRG